MAPRRFSSRSITKSRPVVERSSSPARLTTRDALLFLYLYPGRWLSWLPQPVLDLIRRLRDERSLSYLLISHNLAVVDQLCDACLVLKDGAVVEHGPTAQVLDHPQHPYTQELRAAVPEITRA